MQATPRRNPLTAIKIQCTNVIVSAGDGIISICDQNGVDGILTFLAAELEAIHENGPQDTLRLYLRSGRVIELAGWEAHDSAEYEDAVHTLLDALRAAAATPAR
jgi:hypothetical protein